METLSRDTLKPGIYLQQGDNIVKAGNVKSGGDLFTMLFGGGVDQGIEKLAALVGWVYVAISARRDMIVEIPYQWQQRDNEIDFMPFSANWAELLPRIEEALSLYSVAYCLKQRVGRRVTGIRWLDPKAITPDETSADLLLGSYGRYWYASDNGKQTPINAEDLLVWKIKGMRELAPGTSAAMATKLSASIIYGIQQTSETFFSNNGLPVMLIVVPDEVQQDEKDKLQRRFKSIFNGGKGTLENRTVAVRQSITVTPLSLAPADLAQKETKDDEMNLILAAFRVPKSVVLSDAANYATDINATRRFVSTMAARLNYIADVINADPDFIKLRLWLKVLEENHYAMQQDEAERSSSFLNYVNGGMTPQASAYLFGIRAEDFPPGIQVFADKPEPAPVAIEPAQPLQLTAGDVEDESGEADMMKAAELKQFKAWYKKRQGSDVAKFIAHHISHAEKLIVAEDVLKDVWETYP